MRRVLLVLLVAAVTTAGLHAQWLRIPTAGIPRLPNGRADLAAPAPRTAEDGRLAGLWKPAPARLIADIAAGLAPAKRSRISRGPRR